MALSNPNHANHDPYKVYVFTQPINGGNEGQSMEAPMLTLKFNVKVIYVTAEKDDNNVSMKSFIQDHESWHEFEHPANELTRDSISNMLGNIRIPFSWGNLHWKKGVNDKDYVPLMSTDDLAASMFDVCHGMVSESGRKKLCLIVLIKKEVVLPRDGYAAMAKAKEAEKVLGRLEVMVRMQAQGRNFSRWEQEQMTNLIREAGLGNSLRDGLGQLSRRMTRESRRQAVVRWVPAAATSIQGLEKVACNLEDKCSVCMEEMLVGLEVTRMPCFHVFHGHCIEKWLSTSHMCPVCRFKLPTEQS